MPLPSNREELTLEQLMYMPQREVDVYTRQEGFFHGKFKVYAAFTHDDIGYVTLQKPDGSTKDHNITDYVFYKYEEKSQDMVNHPPHYEGHPSGVECIQITRHMNFNLGNVIKYVWRSSSKGDTIEDLKKAAWYLQDEIEKLERESL